MAESCPFPLNEEIPPQNALIRALSLQFIKVHRENETLKDDLREARNMVRASTATLKITEDNLKDAKVQLCEAHAELKATRCCFSIFTKFFPACKQEDSSSAAANATAAAAFLEGSVLSTRESILPASPRVPLPLPLPPPPPPPASRLVDVGEDTSRAMGSTKSHSTKEPIDLLTGDNNFHENPAVDSRSASKPLFALSFSNSGPLIDFSESPPQEPSRVLADFSDSSPMETRSVHDIMPPAISNDEKRPRNSYVAPNTPLVHMKNSDTVKSVAIQTETTADAKPKLSLSSNKQIEFTPPPSKAGVQDGSNWWDLWMALQSHPKLQAVHHPYRPRHNHGVREKVRLGQESTKKHVDCIGPVNYATKPYPSAFSDDWRKEMKCPELFFTFGIQYEPRRQSKTHMRVVISPLPLDITYTEVFAKIRGDVIISCEILGPLPMIQYNCKTALVRFKTEAGAVAYARFTHVHPLNFRGMAASVRMISTPTYPLPKRTAVNVYQKNVTRVLHLSNIPQRVTRDILLADMAKAAGLNTFQSRPTRNALPITPPASDDFFEANDVTAPGSANRNNSLKRTEDWGHWPLTRYRQGRDERNSRVIELSFTGVDFAGRAYAILSSFRTYSGSYLCHAKDPCAGPLRELLGQPTTSMHANIKWDDPE